MEDKIRCYELDFGDTNLISRNADEILEWINTDILELSEGYSIDYKIKVKMLTNEEFENLPEWS